MGIGPFIFSVYATFVIGVLAIIALMIAAVSAVAILASIIIPPLVSAALALASFIASNMVAIALAATAVAAAMVAVALVIVVAENIANSITNLTQSFRSWFNTPASRDNEPVVAVPVPVASANHVPMAEVVYPDPHTRGNRFFNEHIPPYNPAYIPETSHTFK